MTDDSIAWMRRGNCVGVEADIFFPEIGESVRAAKALCKDCEVRAQCLDHALRNREYFGIWGGTSGQERKKIWRSRRKAKVA